MVKFTILLKRKVTITHAAFVEHHRHSHAPLFMSVPIVKELVRGYVQQHALPIALPGLPAVKYDGVTELWFDDVDAISRLFADPEYLRVIRPDEASFLDLEACDFIVSAETVVLPPT